MTWTKFFQMLAGGMFAFAGIFQGLAMSGIIDFATVQGIVGGLIPVITGIIAGIFFAMAKRPDVL